MKSFVVATTPAMVLLLASNHVVFANKVIDDSIETQHKYITHDGSHTKITKEKSGGKKGQGMDGKGKIKFSRAPTFYRIVKPTPKPVKEQAPTNDQTQKATERPSPSKEGASAPPLSYKPTSKPFPVFETSTPTNTPAPPKLTDKPTAMPTNKPTDKPETSMPTNKPTDTPTRKPETAMPTNKHIGKPETVMPTNKHIDMHETPETPIPTSKPTKKLETWMPTNKPTTRRTSKPTTSIPTNETVDEILSTNPEIQLTPFPSMKPTDEPFSGTTAPSPKTTFKATPSKHTTNPSSPKPSFSSEPSSQGSASAYDNCRGEYKIAQNWNGHAIEPDGAVVVAWQASLQQGVRLPYVGVIYNDIEGEDAGYDVELCERLDDGRFWHCDGTLINLYGCEGHLAFSGVHQDANSTGYYVITGGTGKFLGVTGYIDEEYSHEGYYFRHIHLY